MSRKTGFFIRYTLPFNRTIEELVVPCKDLLLEIKPGASIDTFQQYSKHGVKGVKCFIKDATILREVFKKKFLRLSNQNLSIHPLTTNVILHNFVPESDEDFMDETKTLMGNKFGLVLGISKVPLSRKYPDIGSGNWKIVLDIPEIHDSDDFKNAGLPDDGVLKYIVSDFELKMTFCCSICEQDGHSTHECATVNGVLSMVSLPSTSRHKTGGVDTPGWISSGFYIRDLVVKKETTSILEAIEGEIGEQEIVNSYGISSVPGGQRLCVTPWNRRSASTDEDMPLSKKHCSNENFVPDNNTDGLSEEEHSRSVCTSESGAIDSDVEFISHSQSPLPGPSQIKTEDDGSTNPFQSAMNNDASNVPGPSNIHTFSHGIKSELALTEEDDSDFSDDSYAESENKLKTKVIPKRKTKVLQPIIIPEWFRYIFHKVAHGVLNIEDLQAFLNHAKKKNNPSLIARHYTKDVEGLKRQLQAIVHAYYRTPVTSGFEDKQFMKWFVCLVDRFNGQSSRRKRRKQKD